MFVFSGGGCIFTALDFPVVASVGGAVITHQVALRGYPLAERYSLLCRRGGHKPSDAWGLMKTALHWPARSFHCFALGGVVGMVDVIAIAVGGGGHG